MQKQPVFHAPLLAGFLLVPQVSIVLIFFYWPAAQAVWQSFLLQDAFGLSTRFVWFENYADLLTQPEYFNAIVRTFAFSAAIAGSSLSFALLLAVMADKPIRGAGFYRPLLFLLLRGAGAKKPIRGAGIYRTLLIWPYAVAPAVAGVLWVFMLHPSLGVLTRGLRNLGIDWNPYLNGDHAMIMVVLAAAWKQISYNFLFFLAGLQAIPKSVLEAAAIDGARPMRRFWTVTFPLLTPTIFFLIVVNIVYAFFDTFGIIDAMTGGGPAKATETLVYKVYLDGLLGGNLGSSAAQSVMLMIIVIGLTAIQFRYVERKVTY